MKLSMCFCVGVTAIIECCSLIAQGQGLQVDQASGTPDEPTTQGTLIPDFGAVAQSFTPAFSAVGFVQFETFIPAISGGETLVVNLRAGTYDGPIVSSTTPVFIVYKGLQDGTFYFPNNVPVVPNQLYFFEPTLLSTGSLSIGYKPSSTYSGGD